MVKDSDLRLIDKMIDKKINQLKIQLLEAKEAKEAKEETIIYQSIATTYTRGIGRKALYITIPKLIVDLKNLKKSQPLYFIEQNATIEIYFKPIDCSIPKKISGKGNGYCSISIPEHIENSLAIKITDKLRLTYYINKITLKKP